MGIEGRERENPFKRGIEARDNRNVEDEARNPSWLSKFINPEDLKRFRRHHAFRGQSTEWVIMNALLYRLVEQGPEMDPRVKARLRNLVGVLRMIFYPNMTRREQEFVYDLVTKTTTVDFSFAKLDYEVTPETREDVKWIWETFGLKTPSGQQVQALPAPFSQTIGQLGLRPNTEVQ